MTFIEAIKIDEKLRGGVFINDDGNTWTAILKEDCIDAIQPWWLDYIGANFVVLGRKVRSGFYCFLLESTGVAESKPKGS